MEDVTQSAGGPVILDNRFVGSDNGLRPPTARTGGEASGPAAVARSGAGTLQTTGPLLRITNLDRQPPPEYRSGGVPRRSEFNRNVFVIKRAPRMPEIPVNCQIRGFDPARSPIQWRLQCRWVLCRHMSTGTRRRYESACEFHEDEWQGRSTSPDFVLFRTPRHPAVAYAYNDETRVMGGHAILSVAARLPGSGGWLLDYVHLRIGGENPVRADADRYVDAALHGRDSNVVAMLRAIFVHESNYRQFHGEVQTANRYARVRFNWPDDPARFPLGTFDFGVGLSQYTRSRTQPISRGVAWDWRENIRAGTNLFLTAKLRGTYRPGSTWREWAHRAWRAYNGTGEAATAYATGLAASFEGRRVSSDPVPSRLDLATLTAPIPAPPQAGAAPTWPPQVPPRP